jgi:hypothetical protein
MVFQLSYKYMCVPNIPFSHIITTVMTHPFCTTDISLMYFSWSVICVRLLLLLIVTTISRYWLLETPGRLCRIQQAVCLLKLVLGSGERQWLVSTSGAGLLFKDQEWIHWLCPYLHMHFMCTKTNCNRYNDVRVKHVTAKCNISLKHNLTQH